jgi:hypothetical protein
MSTEQLVNVALLARLPTTAGVDNEHPDLSSLDAKDTAIALAGCGIR